MKNIATAFLLLLASFVSAQPCPEAKKPEGGQAEYGRGYRPPTPEQREKFHAERRAAHGGRMVMLAKNQALPPAFDCRDKGWVLPMGDQGNCGSCYVYSTVYGTLSQAFVRAGYGKADGSFVMSVQFGMDCHNFGGCNGGNGTEVIDWILRNGWPAETWVDIDGKVHKDYPPYEARSRACREAAGTKRWKIATWGYATGDQSNRAATTEEIKTALFNYGPLNVSLAAGGQFGSGAGTITQLGTSIDHEIELVAWDDAKDGGAFLLKNQWSTAWGNQGYRWCTYNACKRLVDVFWVSVSPLPPPPPPPDPDPPVPPIPPGPTPAGATITLSKDLKAGTYELHPSGTKARLEQIQRLLDELRLGPVPQEPQKKSSAEWDALRVYAKGEVIYKDGIRYVAVKDHFGSAPPSSSWRTDAMVEKLLADSEERERRLEKMVEKLLGKP